MIGPVSMPSSTKWIVTVMSGSPAACAQNDATRPLIHAIPPRRTAELALRVAADTDERIASLPPDLLAKTWPSDPRSPLNALRADHRAEHLDEIEAALRK